MPFLALGRGALVGDHARPWPRPDAAALRHRLDQLHQLLAWPAPPGPPLSSSPTIAATRASSWSAGTTSSTRPMRSASARIEPLGGQEPAPRLARADRARPRTGAITAGTMPSRTSLVANCGRLGRHGDVAGGDQARRRRRPPRPGPCAITGFGQSSIVRSISSQRPGIGPVALLVVAGRALHPVEVGRRPRSSCRRRPARPRARPSSASSACERVADAARSAPRRTRCAAAAG